MSAQRLNPRSVRRIAASTGLPVLRGWSHGGYWLPFVTTDHRHGRWHRRTHELAWEDHPMHYTSCAETWPDDVARDHRRQQSRWLRQELNRLRRGTLVP